MSNNPTAPGAPDAQGVPFDPVVHQAWKTGAQAGQARTDAKGRWIMKSRVNIPAARARLAKAAGKPAAPPAPPRAPQAVPVATPAEILGGDALAGVMDDAPTPTAPAPGAADGPPPPPPGPEGPAPTASTIGAEPVGDAPPDEVRGTAMMFAGLAEMAGRVVFDAGEWELDAPRRGALTGAIEDKLRADGGPNLTPGQRLACTVLAVFGPNLAKPKTKTKVGGWWARLFGRKPKEKEEKKPDEAPPAQA